MSRKSSGSLWAIFAIFVLTSVILVKASEDKLQYQSANKTDQKAPQTTTKTLGASNCSIDSQVAFLNLTFCPHAKLQSTSSTPEAQYSLGSQTYSGADYQLTIQAQIIGIVPPTSDTLPTNQNGVAKLERQEEPSTLKGAKYVLEKRPGMLAAKFARDHALYTLNFYFDDQQNRLEDLIRKDINILEFGPSLVTTLPDAITLTVTWSGTSYEVIAKINNPTTTDTSVVVAINKDDNFISAVHLKATEDKSFKATLPSLPKGIYVVQAESLETHTLLHSKPVTINVR